MIEPATPDLRIIVLRAGGIGGYFAGRLAESGADVTFVVLGRGHATEILIGADDFGGGVVERYGCVKKEIRDRDGRPRPRGRPSRQGLRCK